MGFNYIDEVDSTLTITNKETGRVISLTGKVLNYTASNPLTTNIIKDNLTKSNKFIKYRESNREASTLDFNYVNIGGKTLQELKDFFFNNTDLDVLLVSGSDGKSKLVFNPCVLKMEPMAPNRSSNFEGQLSFIGGYIEEVIIEE
jgi:hypothetical protein